MGTLNFMLKNLPSKYVFAGYNVKKGLSVMSHVENNKMIYDIFLYTYMEDKLSFYILMDDGKYKNVESNQKVDELSIDKVISRHLFSGEEYDIDDYEQVNKEELAGVFALRNMEELMQNIDDYETKIGTAKLMVRALYDAKASYTGFEINNIISRYNKSFSKYNGYFTVPAISYGAEDTYKSAIGDEIEFFDLINEKTNDEIVEWLRTMSTALDGLGNVKS